VSKQVIMGYHLYDPFFELVFTPPPNFEVVYLFHFSPILGDLNNHGCVFLWATFYLQTTTKKEVN
jgi:hypothetical protein